MTPDESVAVATWGLVLATAGLIVVTFLLVRDGAQKSKEQSKRWEEEDKRRAEEAKPTAVVELATITNSRFNLDLFFACFNLGNNTFFIDKLIVTASDGTRDEADLAPKIVTPGTYVTIGYDPGQIMGMFGENTEFKEANAVLVLKGATGSVTTEPVWFYVFYRSGGQRCGWGMGRLAEREPGIITKVPKILPEIPTVPKPIEPEVLDEYGNNAAVRCSECDKVFVFSKHLNQASGRNCPHCNGSKAILTVDGVQVERTGDLH
ncbi:MAG: hypothetical protein WDN23_15830 [Edaphobacter sp.]